jgi:hypothetical protein
MNKSAYREFRVGTFGLKRSRGSVLLVLNYMKAYLKSCVWCRNVGGLIFMSSCEIRLRGKVWNFRWLRGVK